MKNSLLKITTISAFCLAGGFSAANAQALTPQEDLEIALNALPEFADEIKNSAVNKSSVIKIKCYVDTPAYDTYSYNSCFNVGWARTTTAVFNLENVPSGSGVIWSNNSCTANSNYCFLPIRHYQSVSVTATILKPDSTYSTVNATAYYEGYD